MKDEHYLKIAVEQARKSIEAHGFPDGAIVVKDDSIVGRGISIGNVLHDPTAHAESVAIRDACKYSKTTSLAQATLYASLEPCNMCFCASAWAGIKRIVYAYRKTPEMIDKKYYEGSVSSEELNAKNSHKIEIVFLPDFEEEMKVLISKWELSR